jgi:transposase
MSSIILTKEQREELVAQHKSERDRRICDRIKAVLMCADGYTYTEIAKVLLLTHEAIRKHIKDWELSKKLNTHNGGSASKLNKQQQSELAEHLESHNYVYTKDVCAYVENKYGVRYTIAGMIKLLHRLDFSYKKPKLVPGKLDAQKQEDWRYQYKLLKGSLKKQEVIYFMDAVHPQYQTRARCGWIRKNQEKTLPTFSGWKRKHIIGAIELDGLKVVSSEKNRVNGEGVIEFLKQLELSEPEKEKIYLICDNAGYHKSKKVKEYLVNSKIELIFLPPYSPNLNPIERLWKYMHRIVSNNKWYSEFKYFSEAVDRFFANIPKYHKNLATLINDNFQPIVINHFCNSSG